MTYGANSETFNTSGNFEVPAGVFQLTVEAWGGGASAGFHVTGARSGAGGGAYARSRISVTPGATYPVVVGAGGAARSSNAFGDGGGSSYFDDGSELLAAGGAPNALSTPSLGGAAADSVGNEAKYSGGSGGIQEGTSAGHAGGGGGGSATATANGTAGSAGASGTGGTGGAGQGAGGNGGNGSSNGSSGSAPGGGGGGNGSGGTTSGAGAAGRVIVWWDEGPAIESVDPDSFQSGATLVITGASFSASGNTVEMGDSATYGSATKVTQTITAEGTTSITVTHVKGAHAFGPLWAFVTDDDSNVSAGYPVELLAPPPPPPPPPGPPRAGAAIWAVLYE